MTGFAFGGREHGGSEECPRLNVPFSRESLRRLRAVDLCPCRAAFTTGAGCRSRR